MTVSEMKDMLSIKGYSMDTWTSLDKYSNILFNSDNRLFLGKDSTEVYFGSDGLLYIRNYDSSRPIECAADTVVPVGYTKIQFDDKYFLFKLLPGYYVSNSVDIGSFHTVIAIQYVAGLIDISINVNLFK